MEDLAMIIDFENYYKGKKIFVTGHTGFKGAWFITWLHLLGADIKGYALEPENKNGIFGIIKDKFAFQHITADIRNAALLHKEITSYKPDFIFHLAAQSLVRKSYQLPSETFDVNVTGTCNVLEAVKLLENKCTVIVVTTDKVYENKEQDYHYKETDTLGGYDPYSASKAAAEIAVSSFRNSFFNPSDYSKHKKAIISVRAGNVIGGGDWNKDRIIPDIIKALSQNQPVFVRNPHAIRPWQHVLEPLGGYLLAAMKADIDALKFSGAYNFGPQANDHLTVKELVETAITIWGNGTWLNGYDATQPHEASMLQLSIDKAIRELGWKPKLNSREAIEWTINWYRQSKEEAYNYTVAQIKKYCL
jgi:CDP-glucose 4,6-dehydratase